MVLLALHLRPGNIFAWLAVGLIAGAVAGRLARGRGFGCLGDIVVGLLGAFVGGLIVDQFIHGNETTHFWGSTGVAILGALVLILVLRLFRTAL